MDTERGWTENLKLAMLLAQSGVVDEVQAAYQAYITADTVREKVAATQPLQLTLAEMYDRWGDHGRPRGFDEARDYHAEAERKLGDGKLLQWLMSLLTVVGGLTRT